MSVDIINYSKEYEMAGFNLTNANSDPNTNILINPTLHEFTCAMDNGPIHSYTKKNVKTGTLPKEDIDDLNFVDTDWVSSRFIVSGLDLNEQDRSTRYFSSASWKWSSTMLGGHPAINVKPQFTRTCDIKTPYVLGHKEGYRKVGLHKNNNLGMGRYYSEAIDDNEERIYLQFGLPQFNSLIMFYLRAVNYSDSVMANKGRVPIGYSVGAAVGNVATWVVFPFVALGVFVGKVIFGILYGNNFSYYHMKPAMHMYWTTANDLLNQMAVELGFIPPNPLSKNDASTKANKKEIGTTIEINPDYMNELAKLWPGVINPTAYYIDVYSIAARPQAIAARFAKAEYEQFADQNGSIKDGIAGLYQKLTSKFHEEPKVDVGGSGGEVLKSVSTGVLQRAWNQHFSISNLISLYTGSKFDPLNGRDKADSGSDVSDKEVEDQLEGFQNEKGESVAAHDKTKDMTFKQSTSKMAKEWLDQGAAMVEAVAKDGGSHLILHVNYSGSNGETFSNSVGNIDAEGGLKNISNNSRNVKFNLAGGNGVPGIGAVVGLAKDVVFGAVDKLSFGLMGTIAALMGGANITLPKKWEDSDASFPQISYTIHLRSPYGSPMAQIQNIYLPLCCLLAGTLPLATGGASYTSPFLCSVFNKGQQITNLGMITSLQITRGTTNLGFDSKRRPLGIDVSFTVTDFSTVVAAPVNTSAFDPAKYTINVNNESAIGRYIGVLCGRDIYTQMYAGARAKQKLALAMMKFGQVTSASNWGMLVGEKIAPVIRPFMRPKAIDQRELNEMNQK